MKEIDIYVLVSIRLEIYLKYCINEYKDYVCIFHAMKCRSIFFHLLEDLGGNDD